MVEGTELLSRAAVFELTSEAPWSSHLLELIKHQQTSIKDFEISNAEINEKFINDKIIEKYAPNVVEGIKKLSNWAKNL